MAGSPVPGGLGYGGEQQGQRRLAVAGTGLGPAGDGCWDAVYVDVQDQAAGALSARGGFAAAAVVVGVGLPGLGQLQERAAVEDGGAPGRPSLLSLNIPGLLQALSPPQYIFGPCLSTTPSPVLSAAGCSPSVSAGSLPLRPLGTPPCKPSPLITSKCRYGLL